MSQDRAAHCPFCGSYDLELVEDVDGVLVICETCGGRGPSKLTELEAIKGWNRRSEGGAREARGH